MGKKLTYEEVKRRIETDEYKLISDEYVNNNTKLEIKCNKGHIFDMSYAVFIRGSRCPICNRGWLFYYNIRGMKKEAYEYIKSNIELCGYKLLSDKYDKCDTLLDVKCEHGHIFTTNPDFVIASC